MRLRRFALGLLGITAAALVSALPAAGKEGVEATLTTRIRLDAPAGARLRVGWTLTYLDEHGKRHPFGAGGVFVRLRSASGAAAKRGFAPRGAYPRGEYSATVVVPKGGIGDVEIGLRGWADGPHGRREADLLFPIANDPVPGAARVASAGSGQSVSERRGTARRPGSSFSLPVRCPRLRPSGSRSCGAGAQAAWRALPPIGELRSSGDR